MTAGCVDCAIFTVKVNGAQWPVQGFQAALAGILAALARHAAYSADMGDLADAGIYVQKAAQVLEWRVNDAIPEVWTWEVRGPDHCATSFSISRGVVAWS